MPIISKLHKEKLISDLAQGEDMSTREYTISLIQDVFNASQKGEIGLADFIENIEYILQDIKNIANLNRKKKISIPLSDNDLQELQAGETFDWTFDGVDVHLYQTNEDTE